MRTTLGTAAADDDVRAAIRRLGAQFERDYIVHTTLNHWNNIMGDMVARRVRAVYVKDGKLFLYAPDAVWKNEMRMSSPEIVRRVNNYAGGRMIKEIAFTRRAREEVPEEDGGDVETSADYARAVVQTGLSDAEIARGDALAHAAEDDDLVRRLQRAYQTSVKARRLKEKRGDTPCPSCGRLVHGVCLDCARAVERERRRQVRAVLRQTPWAKLSEVVAQVPSCTALTLGSERADLVREIASRTEYGDQSGENAYMITMLHRTLPRDAVTPKHIRLTFWELRNELITTREFWENLKKKSKK
ncbi:DUF721 domain-containing protein [Selenomonas sp. F0473]|uniref:DUF721 domain-containing protein n=1 Tax=Selenomonas sp. F0473 TaxID=999423 RepID=UPI0025ECDDE0|nr:DUF721 domain-containing protein [Selenomonas sp. F0473]